MQTPKALSVLEQVELDFFTPAQAGNTIALAHLGNELAWH